MGRVFAWWLIIAFNLTFLPMFWLGVQGMNRRIADYPEAYAGVNEFISWTSFLMGASFLLFAFNLLWSAFRGKKAPPNPWNATTLEWMVPSPPPEHNFPLLPEVVGHPYHYGAPGAEHALVPTSERADDR